MAGRSLPSYADLHRWSIEVTQVERDGECVVVRHLSLNPARHDVARREFRQRMDIKHEALSIAVAQIRALTSDRL